MAYAGLHTCVFFVCRHVMWFPVFLSAYLLHGSAENAVALVIRYLNRPQKLDAESLDPRWVSFHACRVKMWTHTYGTCDYSDIHDGKIYHIRSRSTHPSTPWTGLWPRGRRRQERCPSPLSACYSLGTSSRPLLPPHIKGRPHRAPARLHVWEWTCREQQRGKTICVKRLVSLHGIAAAEHPIDWR